jgi:hypothetical protein
VLLVITNLQTCKSLEFEKKQSEIDNKMNLQNIKAMTDTLTVRFDKKIDNTVTEKTSFIVGDIKDLKQYNESFYKELKNIKGAVVGIESEVSGIIPSIKDDIKNAMSDPKDSTKFTIPWNFNYKDSGLTQDLSGRTIFKVWKNKPTTPMNSSLDTNKFSIKLKYNVVDENGKYKVQAISKSNLVKFDDLNSVLILDKMPSQQLKKQNPWSFGPYFGFGLNTDEKFANSRFGWSVGIGGSYNMFTKTRKK